MDQMEKYSTKMETTTKLNLTMIKLIFNGVLNVTKKWKEQIWLHLALLIFFSIYLGCVSCLYFSNITLFITGNASLILKIFNIKTYIILFVIRKLLFFSDALLFTILLLIFLNHICHLIFYCSISFIVMSIRNSNYNFIPK